MASLHAADRIVLRMDLGQRIQHVLLATSFIALGVTGFALYQRMTNRQFQMVMSVLLVTSAVVITSQIDHFWVAINDHLTGFGGGLSARLGLGAR